MKIFNTTVNKCVECDYHNDKFSMCYYNGTERYIENTQIIHHNCPFNQPITRKIIESFGFKLFTTDDLEQLHFELINNNVIYKMTYKDGTISHIIGEHIEFNIPIVNLPFLNIISIPHLEFIINNIIIKNK